MSTTGKVVSVNVGSPRDLVIKGRERKTGIFKEPQTGRVPIAGVTVGDDVQMDKEHHGGRWQAVYAYSVEDYRWWSSELDLSLAPGTFGENITTEGLDLTEALIGEQWKVGTALIEVSDPRIPCSTLAARMRELGVKSFAKRFAAARRFGPYFLIVEEGDVAAGDTIEVIHRPDHGVRHTDIADLALRMDVRRAEEVAHAFPREEQRERWLGFVREG
jgi:MOSC domain-containing protein YiiM